MAQILKDDVRDNIIESAKQEFEEYGFEKSSMRRIALKSKMTVGNLYRYFKSKEELSETIVSPTYQAINSVVEKLSGGSVQFGTDGTGFSASPEEMHQMLNSLAESLVEIHKKHRTELNILMMGSKLNKELTDWFTNVLANMAEANFPQFKATDPQVQLLAKCYADAIFSGIKTILRSWTGDDTSLQNMIQIYLNSYLLILEQEKLMIG